MGRGADRRELYKPLLAGAHSFIIHNTGERHVLAGRRKVETAVLAAQRPMMCPGIGTKAETGVRNGRDRARDLNLQAHRHNQ